MIDRLLEDHARMGRQMAELRALVAEPTPPTDLAQLVEARWALAREVMQHLPREERIVYHALAASGRPDLIAAGRKFRAALDEQFGAFHTHAARWTAPAVVADWAGYGRALNALLDMLAARRAAEEAELYPLAAGLTLPTAIPARKPGDRNWAADGMAIRQSLTAT